MASRKRRHSRTRGRRAHQHANTSAVVPLVLRRNALLRIRKLIPSVIASIVLLSVYVTIFINLAPRVTVKPLPLMDPQDTNSTIFSVTNNAPMDINNVVIMGRFANFYIRYLSPGHVAVRKRLPGETKRSEIGDISAMTMVNGFHRRITPQGSEMLKLPLSMPKEEHLDIEIIVEYRPAWYPIRRKKVFRFVTQLGADGEIRWLPRSDAAPTLFDPPGP